MGVTYKMADTALGTTVKEKDFDVTISASVIASDQYDISASIRNKKCWVDEE